MKKENNKYTKAKTSPTATPTVAPKTPQFKPFEIKSFARISPTTSFTICSKTTEIEDGRISW